MGKVAINMKVVEQSWAWLSPLGWGLVVVGTAMAMFATVIAYRFFNQNSVVKYCLKFAGFILCLVGFMLAVEMYR